VGTVAARSAGSIPAETIRAHDPLLARADLTGYRYRKSGEGILMVVITGGAGFIGSNLVHYWIEKMTEPVINVDKLTYAGNLQNAAQGPQSDAVRINFRTAFEIRDCATPASNLRHESTSCRGSPALVPKVR
jgi:hypothetical protein